MNKEEYVTKKYFDSWAESNRQEIKQHMIDLTTGFKEQIKGVSDQVKAVDERLTRSVTSLEIRFDNLENKFDHLQNEVTLIKNVLTEKTDIQHTRKLERRVLKLESKYV